MKKLLLAFFLLAGLSCMSQVRFSLATDGSLMRNFSPDQRFWAFGQTVCGDFHVNKKGSLYAWLTYYSAARFRNQFNAFAKDPGTTPSVIGFRVRGTWRFRELSLGYKHYFKGGFDEEKKLNIYSITGFGLMFTRVENVFLNQVDTSVYSLPIAPVQGSDAFKRLILDLGLGSEFPLGADLFLYNELKTCIPTSRYPSLYLHRNKNVPMPFMANVGLRILF